MAATALRRVARRLAAIQERRNFHPDWGALQLQDAADVKLQRDYGAFVELRALAREHGIPIPYDPSGEAPLSNPQSSEVPSYVYFGSVVGTMTWKIGHSRNPLQHRKHLQTANQTRIDILYTVENAGLGVKKALLRYTYRYRSRGRGGTQWRDGLTVEAIRVIIRRLETEGPAFLDGPALPRTQNDGEEHDRQISSAQDI